MLAKHSIRWAIAALALGLGAGSASAQFIVQPFAFTPYQNWNPFNPGYGSYPSYGAYPSYSTPSYYGGTPYYYSDISYSATYTVPGWAVSNSDTSSSLANARWRPTLAPALAVPTDSPLLAVAYESISDSRAMVIVTAPSPQAQIWVEGVLTSQQGSVRRFRTPVLNMGKQYTYDIVAQWTDSRGMIRTASRTIRMRAGDEIAVDLTRE